MCFTFMNIGFADVRDANNVAGAATTAIATAAALVAGRGNGLSLSWEAIFSSVAADLTGLMEADKGVHS